jgi:predicted ATPase
MRRARFLTRVSVMPERVPAYAGFPHGIPFVRDLDLSFQSPVTYLVGESGTGKSTLVEAIAEACGFPVSGGTRNEAAAHHGPEERSALNDVLRFGFARRPRDG